MGNKVRSPQSLDYELFIGNPVGSVEQLHFAMIDSSK